MERRKELQKIEKAIAELEGPEDIPLKYKILTSKMHINVKLVAMQKLEQLDNMAPFDSEYTKLKEWLDNLCRIPFGIHKNVSINNNNINNYLVNTKRHLDKTVFGMEETKENVMQVIGQWITNPESISNPIAIQGPPGTGKTTLVREGIANALGRPFFQINLGGFKDSSSLTGHDYTYVGSRWGSLLNAVIKARCMNPIIYFDELDKISENAYGGGQEIIGILTHLVDTSQNMAFQDKYFPGIELDFSKVLFIFSYNDVSKVDYILNDRLLTINTNGYKMNEKINIAESYLIPSLLKNTGLKSGDIIFPKDVLEYIIDNYTNKEEGVRQLKRCIDISILKINLIKLITENKNKNIDTEEIKKVIKKEFNLEDIHDKIKNNKVKIFSSSVEKVDKPKITITPIEDKIVDKTVSESNEKEVEKEEENKKEVEKSVETEKVKDKVTNKDIIDENKKILKEFDKLGIVIKFPFTLKVGMIKKLLPKKSDNMNISASMMYI